MAKTFIPYGKQIIDADDLMAVDEALRSAWLTTGPRVDEFEHAFAEFCSASEGVAVNSGTAALHAAMRALNIGAGDEVIIPAITFAASSNAVIYEGGTPVFADIEADLYYSTPPLSKQRSPRAPKLSLRSITVDSPPTTTHCAHWPTNATLR